MAQKGGSNFHLDSSFQPAEITKIAVILFIPALICTMGKEIKPWKGVIRVLAWGGFSAAVVYLITDNLSTAIIVIGNNLYHDICTHIRRRRYLSA